MIAFKCKMCGGEMELEEGATVAECPYCLTKQTLPKLDNDKRANMYDRANHFRRQNEYDKAMAIFENILQEDRTDAEAYWSLVLCRYGIEYVEDPATHKRVPTVNRVQYTSILADEDYKSALEYADFAQRSVYESEAKAIDEIQKGILAISKQEKPFDVFICYKETDANGRRTPDSVLANDLYHQLTNEGFKVFFSRITLEDKIGTAYEPYIFAALNSAKVMVVLGTKPEYFNAVWVKNEWSRYLALIRAGADKTLVPAYRDMDPYDLPDEFSHLQAQDMSKLGFMQDLIRGIKKLTTKDTPKVQTVVQQTAGVGANVENLMKRVRLFLEDGNFSSADEYLDRVLDENAEYAPAYIGKVLVKNKMHKEEELGSSLIQYEQDPNWSKAIRFATPEQKKTYEGYLRASQNYREDTRKQEIYENADNLRWSAKDEAGFQKAIDEFSKIIGYLDASEKLEEAKDAKLNFIYSKAKNMLSRATTTSDCEEARKLFLSISDFKDAKQQAENCTEKSNEIIYEGAKKLLWFSGESIENCNKAKAEFSRIRSYKDSEKMIGYCDDHKKEIQYKEAEKIYTGAKKIPQFEEAKGIFQYLGDYKDSASYVQKCKSKIDEINNELYSTTLRMIEEAKFPDDCKKALQYYRGQEASRDYNTLSALATKKTEEINKKIEQEKKEREEELRRKAEKEAARKKRNIIIGVISAVVIVASVLLAVLVIIPKGHYDKGVSLRAEKQWDEAVQEFKQAGNYSDASTQILATYYAEGEYKREIQDWDGAIRAFELAENYSDSSQQISATYYTEGETKRDSQDADGAVAAFEKAANYSDSSQQIESIVLEKKRSYYDLGMSKQSEKNWAEAIQAFEVADDYSDAISQKKECCYQYGLELLNTDILLAKSYFMKCGVSDARAREQIFIINRKTKDRIATGGYHVVGLNSDGTVVSYGSSVADDGEIETSGWTDIVAVYASSRSTFGIKKDGTVVAVGNKEEGNQDVSSWKDIVSISPYYVHTIGLKSNGTVLSAGYKGYKGNDGRLNVSNWSNIVSAETGYNHSVGLRSDGTVVAVGASGNNRGQLKTEEWTDIVAIAAGSHCTFGLKSDGTVVGTGEGNKVEEVSEWTDIVDIAAGHGVAGLKVDGTVVTSGSGFWDADSWTDIVGIKAYDSSLIGLKKDGTVVWTNITSLKVSSFKLK